MAQTRNKYNDLSSIKMNHLITAMKKISAYASKHKSEAEIFDQIIISANFH